MHARKMLLTVLLGGPILGSLAGLAVDPTMLLPPEPSWRKLKPDVIFTQDSSTFVEVPPQDLTPPGWFNYRRVGFTERFAGFSPEDQQRYGEAPTEDFTQPSEAAEPPLEPATEEPALPKADIGELNSAAAPADRAAAVARQVIVAEAAPAQEERPDGTATEF